MNESSSIRLLIYYPSNKRTVPLESMVHYYHKTGINVMFLTSCEWGPLHDALKNYGIQIYDQADGPKIIPGILYRIYFLIKFCKAHHVNIVHSHLQDANVVTIFAQYFMDVKIVNFRHHFYFSNFEYRRSVKEILGEWLVNLLAKKIIVPSNSVHQAILHAERIKPGKMQVLPYIYDFSLYRQPDIKHVQEIKERYPARLLLLMCSRFTKGKRHDLVLRVLNKLIKEGLDIKLLALDEGPEKRTMEKYVESHELSSRIFFMGYRNDFIDYMMACDLLIHPSIGEASNSVVKENAFVGKTAILCKNVGDFDDYIKDKENAFFIDPNNTGSELHMIITKIYNGEFDLYLMGNNLKKTILENFAINQVTAGKYSDLLA